MTLTSNNGILVIETVFGSSYLQAVFIFYSNLIRNYYKNASFNLCDHYFLYFVRGGLGPIGDELGLSYTYYVLAN